MVAIWTILRRSLPWAGRALALVGVVFVVVRLRGYAGQIDLARFDTMIWVLVVGLAISYALANLMLAFAWWNLLSQFGGITSCRWALRTYGISQVAKYIPGNIFHLMGRQTMGAAADVPGWALAKSALGEVVLISATGALFGLLALPLVVPGMTMPQAIAAFAVVVGLAAFGLRYRFGPQATRALGFYIGYLAVSGAMFVGLLELVSTQPVGPRLPWIPFCGAYILAWLAGFLIPGTPAGLGIRELVLLLLLGSRIMEADLLLAIVLHRAVTIVGDVLFFAWASIARPKGSKYACKSSGKMGAIAWQIKPIQVSKGKQDTEKTRALSGHQDNNEQN